MITPDIQEILANNMIWKKIMLFSSTLMESKTVTIRIITKKVAALRKQRLLSCHLLHPEMKADVIHPTRSMYPSVPWF